MFDFTGPTTVNIYNDPEQLRALLRETLLEQLQPLKELIVTQSAQILGAFDGLEDLFEDLEAKVDHLQEAIDNPSDESRLSPEAQAELAHIKDVIAAVRARTADENADGVPTAPEPTPEPVPAPEPVPGEEPVPVEPGPDETLPPVFDDGTTPPPAPSDEPA